MKRIFVVLGLAMSAPAVVQAAEARLWIVQTSGPGNLSDCPDHATRTAMTSSSKARLLTSDAELRWQGGAFTVRGAGGREEDLGQVWDNCFALVVDGQVIAAGAILLPYSARLLRLPVMQLLTRRQGDPLVFELNPGFPASLGLPVPQGWRDTFTRLP